MMKRIAFVIFFEFAVVLFSASGQSILTGHVYDVDSVAVEGAMINLLWASDSSLVATALSDSTGKYGFERVRNGSYLVLASFFGGEPIVKKVVLWSSNPIIVDFAIRAPLQLTESRVVSDGIRISGDTTSYTVGHFATGAERNLKDILERLPRVEVNVETNTVLANGKYVNRILIENQDLFQGNRSLPLKHLSAGGIKRIDIIDNYVEYDIYEGFRTSDETVISLQMDEKSKNKIRGEAEITGGVFNRFSLRGSSLYMGRKMMGSGILALNNVGEQLLRFQDIIQFNGGYGNALKGNDPMENTLKLMETYAVFTNNRKDVFKRESGMTALHLTAAPHSKLKIALNGIYGFENSASRREQHISYLSGPQFDDLLSDQTRHHHVLFNLKLHYTPSQDFNVIYTGNLLYSARQKQGVRSLGNTTAVFEDHPMALHGNNQLLLVKRFGKSTMNLSVDYRNQGTESNEIVSSDSSYYDPSMQLAERYQYFVSDKEDGYRFHLFFLTRIKGPYYMQTGVQMQRNEQQFESRLLQDRINERFDNMEKIRYANYFADYLFGKDLGRLTFDARLRFALQKPSASFSTRLNQ